MRRAGASTLISSALALALALAAPAALAAEPPISGSVQNFDAPG